MNHFLAPCYFPKSFDLEGVDLHDLHCGLKSTHVQYMIWCDTWPRSQVLHCSYLGTGSLTYLSMSLRCHNVALLIDLQLKIGHGGFDVAWQDALQPQPLDPTVQAVVVCGQRSCRSWGQVAGRSSYNCTRSALSRVLLLLRLRPGP
jgi:hypothetical protein